MDLNLERTVLGLELGSTRIKAVLLDESLKPVASGSYGWENQLVGGMWTYDLADVHRGLQACYGALKRDVRERFGLALTTVGGIGISGMMHGYLAFDGAGNQLYPFLTWRNTLTGQAAEVLTALFRFNIPQRWSIAHLYQAILNGEEHVSRLDNITTLAGYIHWRLTGERVMGIGEASGMFPIDSGILDYDQHMLDQFDDLVAPKGFPWRIRDVLPRVLAAGEAAGRLTPAGARLLDPEGGLRPGIPLAPCEGDAGTGMVATNSVGVGTGNVSAGTSDFAMVVVDRRLNVYREIDMVTTPSGTPVAMVHCNNCTSDINAWVDLFAEALACAGCPMDKSRLFEMLFRKALEAEPDCGGLLSYNYFSGEGITDLDDGRPVFLRAPNSRFDLANFMRTHLVSALATLKIGLDILTQKENVPIKKLYGHGGFFRTPEVGQRMLSAAVGAPVSLMETAGEGGPYGMALLAAYMLDRDGDISLEDYLNEKVFARARSHTLMADQADIDGSAAFLARYKAALDVERMAIRTLP